MDDFNPLTFVTDFDGDMSALLDTPIPQEMPILPLRGTVFFPGTVSPVMLKRPSSLKLCEEAARKNTIIGVFSQRHSKDEELTNLKLNPWGIAARVIRILDMPDGTKNAIVQGLGRIKLLEQLSTSPYITGIVESAPDHKIENPEMFKLLAEACRDASVALLEDTESIPREAEFAIKNMRPDLLLINHLCAIVPIDNDRRKRLINLSSIQERATYLLKYINEIRAIQDLRKKIQQDTQATLNQQQREYFLQQEIRNIQDELGGPSTTRDSETLRQQADEKDMPQYARETFNRELAKLERLNPQSPDYNVQLNYLQTIVQLPWNHCTTDNLSLQNAERVLNRDHYGMEEVKERILEHLAVLKLRGDMKSPIICLYGPPGVGKTSLGRSIADSLKRNYVRASLGGLHDESEIRGHRRTYIGAMPGRILKNLIKAGSNNPVFILDEIDKISGQTVNGDPSSALLEVLDPEQNSTFHDNFLDMDYDLSNVMFIATANDISAIPRALRDRMELIEVGGYCTEEKTEIARKHLIPKVKEANGLAEHKSLKMNKAAIEFVIEHYTRESGVRGLEKQLNKLFRKTALEIAKGGEMPTTINTEETKRLLGKVPYTRDIYQGNENAGVVTGLAWTSVGGEILFIETSLSKSKGGKLTLTGNLGDVMKESAMLALEYIKAHAEQLSIDIRVFDNWNIHLHVPEGATPKDGPSAGITMATALASALTQRKVRSHLAMTGEITLRGKVLPVGGIKEKLLAAKRAGIREIVICKDNRKDVEDIPEMYLKGVTFHYVDTVEDVLQYALLQEKVKNPIDLSINEQETEK